jgi:gluconokinase
MPESNPPQPREVTEPAILALDVGSSSVRTLLYDGEGREVPGLGVQLAYDLQTTPPGASQVDADFLCDLSIQAISAIHQQMERRRLQPTAVAVCTFWHNVMGVNAADQPTTPVLHSFDTQSAGAARRLADKLDPEALHARTGCILHPSYMPAKLTWLAESQPDAFRATRRWMSFGEYLFLKVTGTAAASTCMVSGSGLWNQNENAFDGETLRALPVEACQLAPESEMDRPVESLRDVFRSRWPLLSGLPWFPALGDGAANNLGCGCGRSGHFALMVGTSGALRSVVDAERLRTPQGLWVYRVDRRRFLVGGALSDGGSVYAWMKKTLQLPPDAETEAALAAMPPLSHGLTVLPFFQGERSPGWRAEARAVIAGLSQATSPLQILYASLEAVALRFRLIFDLMRKSLGKPQRVVASGGALLHSPVWTRMMADALAFPVTPCLENEATSRGAALAALERLGAIPNAMDLPPVLGTPAEPDPARGVLYEQALRLQSKLYRELYEKGEAWLPGQDSNPELFG